MSIDPWYKCTLPLETQGVSLKFRVPHDVFSTVRIDEGTLLLLNHLPPRAPQSILDLGCGYGALGLPLASRFPGARVEMVDRDLLAVHWASLNARENQLLNAHPYGSLGFRDLHASTPFDWILCNVPARIGRPFIEYFLEGARARLNPEGEVRVVVIRDLNPVLEGICRDRNWDLVEAATGPRHSVFRLTAPIEAKSFLPSEPADLYTRDQVEIDGLQFERPFDLGGDDPRRLTHGLPVLLDVLPRQKPARVFCFRACYGQLPLISRNRWPEARITAVDRDLLATTFALRNAEKLGLSGPLLRIIESEHFPRMLNTADKFDLALGELSPSAGEAVACDELMSLAGALRPGGQALILILEKLEKEWIRPFAERSGLSIYRVLAREGFAVLRLMPSSPST